MASFINASSGLAKLCQASAILVKGKERMAFTPLTRRYIMTPNTGSDSSTVETASGVNDMMQTGQQDTKNMGTAAALKEDAEDAAGHVSQTANELSAKARQTAQEAWGSIKETSQKIVDTATNKAQDTKEFVKENAKKVERSMNSKN